MLNRFFTRVYLKLLLCAIVLVGTNFPAQALFVSPPKEPLPLIKEIFPEASKIADKTGEVPVWTIFKGEEIIGYAFETNDHAKIPAYSGEPVNMLVAIDPKGVYLGAKVLEHQEPTIKRGQ